HNHFLDHPTHTYTTTTSLSPSLNFTPKISYLIIVGGEFQRDRIDLILLVPFCRIFLLIGSCDPFGTFHRL
ncbi:hypothetical protein VIGAN_11181700, partial [Vigna angularis var. angularis]